MIVLIHIEMTECWLQMNINQKKWHLVNWKLVEVNSYLESKIQKSV